MTPERKMNDDYKDMQDAVNETIKSPETKDNGFKGSIHLDAYYKGFHIEIIETNPEDYDRNNKLIANAKKRIEVMVTQGFEPSWNKETNNHVKAQPRQPEQGEQRVPICDVHNAPMEWKTGVSKKTGKSYAFWACGERLADGSFCTFKPKV